MFEKQEVTEQMLAQQMSGAPLYTRARTEKLLAEGQRNESLHRMHLGLLAFERGDDAYAKEQLDRVLAFIEVIHTGDASLERDLRRKRITEVAKDFRGEPYERSMAYWYRGLIELTEGNPNGARPYFVSALYQDAVAESEDARSDFASLLYLQGWCSKLIGDDQRAAQAFEAAQALRPELVPPAADHNALIIAELGRAPRKVRDGLGGGKLKFRRGRDFADDSASALLPDGTHGMLLGADIFRQSVTRGTREIDYILTGQSIEFAQVSQFASGTSRVAEGISLANPFLGSSTIGGSIAGGFAAATLISSASQINNTPLADNRYWDNLPDRVMLYTAKLSESDDVYINVLDKTGEVISDRNPVLRKEWAKGHGLYWFKSHSTGSDGKGS
ncbi:MAG: hypothetical protein AAF797_00855 [Planctomycetota bacterium]